MTTPFHLGQTFCANKLIYTTPATTGHSGLHFCDSDGNCEPINRLEHFHPEVDVSRWNLSDDASFAKLGQGRWSPVSVAAFTSSSPPNFKTVYLTVESYLRKFYCAPSSSRQDDPSADDYYRIIATYIVSTYVFTVAEVLPYLHIIGEPNTGKTLLADLIEDVAFNAIQAVSITAPAMYRLLDSTRGALVLDEQEGGSKQWTNVLLAGYRRSGSVMVCDQQTKLPVAMSCFSPKILLTNEPLANKALESRTIQLVSERASSRPSQYLSRSTADVARGIRDTLYSCGLAYASSIAKEYQNLPAIPAVSNRDEDLAALPLAVAKVIDCQDGEQLQLYDALVEFFQKAALRRTKNDKLDATRPEYARAILEFTAKTSSAPSHDNYFLAESFKRFVVKRGLSQPMVRTKQIGELLNRFKLILDRRIVEVTPAEVGVGVNPLRARRARIQRQAYRFDMPTVLQLAEEI